jgi:voltage-gated potassium channel
MSMLVIAIRFWERIRNRPGVGFSTIVLLVLLAMLGNAVTFRLFDSTPQSPISWGDAFWYSIISITTIGYGDLSASSFGARTGTVVFIVFIGLLAFTMMLGLITDLGLAYLEKGRRGMGIIHATGHILIVNYPGEQRLLQLLHELQTDDKCAGRDIVLITDTIQELPPVDASLAFIHGSPLDHDTFKRANAAEASLALMLPADYHRSESDALTASALSVINAVAPKLRVVAECLDDRRRHLFANHQGSHVTIVCGLHVASNMMIQELGDPGISATMEEITSNQGTTLFTAAVTNPKGRNYIAVSQGLLAAGINVLAVMRDGKAHTLFGKLQTQTGDSVVYVGDKRHGWEQLVELAEAAV